MTREWWALVGIALWLWPSVAAAGRQRGVHPLEGAALPVPEGQLRTAAVSAAVDARGVPTTERLE